MPGMIQLEDVLEYYELNERLDITILITPTIQGTEVPWKKIATGAIINLTH